VSKLSVLIPVYNEEQTIDELIRRVKDAPISIEKEILVGDDGSTDATRQILSAYARDPDVRIHLMSQNRGRGGVIKALWQVATGDIFVHQDADLEYDPREYQRLLDPILANRADVVYGSRFLGKIEKMRALNGLGNRTLTAMCRLLYGVRLTDLMTCYKMYRATLTDDLQIDANGFDFEGEFTARLIQRRARLEEVPVSFVGRSFEEGKKIRAVDALKVTRRLLACRYRAPQAGSN
jgi:glycosyltransferase involved in cell wall biosynthesis